MKGDSSSMIGKLKSYRPTLHIAMEYIGFSLFNDKL